MAKFTLILIFVLIPSLLAECNSVKNAPFMFGRSMYNFSVNLVTKTAKNYDYHFVTSTLSVWMLLAYLSLGATDKTKEEMKLVLKLHKDNCYNMKYLEIANMVRSDSYSDVILEKNSCIFISDQISILNKYKTTLTQMGISQVRSLSFVDSEIAAQIVNNFTKIVTHNIIQEIVSPEDFDDVLMIIVDAIYFRGSWRLPFPHINTRASPFYNDRDEQIGTVNLMSLSGSFNHTMLYDINAQVLELPYGHNNKYSMVLFLPFEEIPLSNVIETLRKITIKEILNSLENSGEPDIKVQLPRFKIASDIKNLKELLVDMGLNSMFDSSRARFSKISGTPMHVSNFIQKASVEVSEEGTTATAVTKADLTLRSMGENFIANKPFLFMIMHKQIKVPIFIVNAGQNTITRRSTESILTIPFEQTFRDLSAQGSDARAPNLASFNFCGCGWPQHMLVPRGTETGMPYELFVMLSNYDLDSVNNPDGTQLSCVEASSFCGLKDRLYPDRRNMGYPFDRPSSTAANIQDFILPNMSLVDVTVRLQNVTEQNPRNPSN